jgi:hypothetical protein
MAGDNQKQEQMQEQEQAVVFVHQENVEDIQDINDEYLEFLIEQHIEYIADGDSQDD